MLHLNTVVMQHLSPNIELAIFMMKCLANKLHGNSFVSDTIVLDMKESLSNVEINYSFLNLGNKHQKLCL